MITPIHQVHVHLANRYLKILEDNEPQKNEPDCTGVDHLINMCHWLIKHPDMPIDKQSRWIGFIQGVMVMRGFVGVQEERDITRPMFYEAYVEMDMSAPISVEINKE